MAQYKVKLSLTELYETVIEADSELEAVKIADDMDIEEFNETGIITNEITVEKGQGRWKKQ